VRVLMLTARPGIAGPLPKLAPLVIREMRALGCEVSTADWSRGREHESVLVKTFVRTADLWRVRQLLRTRQFDVMLVTTTHDRRALLRDIPLMALRRGRCARVLHFHGSMVDELHEPGRRLFKACTRWLVGRSDAVLVLSEEERRKWQAFCPATRFEVVVNPFEPAQSGAGGAQGRHAPPGLLFVGRLIREKGIFDLLAAMPAVVADQACVLRIAGQGPCEAEIRTRVDELGLSGRVQLLGYVEGEALAKLYAASDVLVLPTYFGEGFPTVIAEAMSHGLAIVTTPIRGAADHLREGENALFVAPKEPGQLAAALSRLLNDSALRADMGERNRERVKAFAPDAVVPRYVEIMRGVVGT
jgi:glycosyltransferase involved in cell wall biosynthesis